MGLLDLRINVFVNSEYKYITAAEEIIIAVSIQMHVYFLKDI